MFDVNQVLSGLDQYREPAGNMGLLKEPVLDASIPTKRAVALLTRHFDVSVTLSDPRAPVTGNLLAFPGPKERTGVRISDRCELWLEQVGEMVGLHDLLREAGMLVELQVYQAFGGERRRSENENGTTQPLSTIVYGTVFKRETTPGYYVGAVGLNTKDHKRGYANPSAGVFNAMALALLWKLDLRVVFLELLNRTIDQEDPVLSRLINLLGMHSGVILEDQADLRNFAHAHYELSPGPENHYKNVSRVAALATFFAQRVLANVRARRNN
jgi:hypothetical protein